MFRFSTRPHKQLLWLWLKRDMIFSKGYDIGIDVGSGAMLNKPWFETKKYIAIDSDFGRLIEGKCKFPEATILNENFLKSKIKGDFVLCIQVFVNKHFDSQNTMIAVKKLIDMVVSRGTLIFNIARKGIGFENGIDMMLETAFRKVKKRKYGHWFMKDMWWFGVSVGLLLYAFPFLTKFCEKTNIYYVCGDKIA